MTMPSFEQVESSHRKKEPCERGCNWIVKFCHCLNFGYRKYGIIILSAHTMKKICEVRNF